MKVFKLLDMHMSIPVWTITKAYILEVVSFETLYVVCDFSVNLWSKLLPADIRLDDCIKIQCMDPEDTSHID